MDKLLPAERTTTFEYLSDMSDEEVYGIIQDGYTDFLFDICYNMTLESMSGEPGMEKHFEC